MIKKILLFLMLCLNFTSFAQETFKNGYIINDSNERINCLINDEDWVNSPTTFTYKLTEDSELIEGDLNSINEFGVNNKFKYIKRSVGIDRSSINVNKLSNNRDLVFVEEILFLKVLVEGKANLYMYKSGTLERYFYNVDNGAIDQLIYKNYIINDDKISENNGFRLQLMNDLNCLESTAEKTQKLDYSKGDLVDYFVSFNQCENVAFEVFKDKKIKGKFNLSLRPRLNSSSLSIENKITNSLNENFDKKTGFGFGVEALYTIPYFKNKLGFIVEGVYQSYSVEKTTLSPGIFGGEIITKVDYNILEIPFGLRYYQPLNQNSKLFVNASYVLTYEFDSKMEQFRSDGTVLSSVELDSNVNFAFGLGYQFIDKFGLEFRYQTSKNITVNNGGWVSDFDNMSLIFGYSIF